MSLVYSPNILGSSSSGENWYISTLPCLGSLMAGSYVKKDQGVASVISTRTRPCSFFQWKREKSDDCFIGKTQLLVGGFKYEPCWARLLASYDLIKVWIKVWFQICLYFHPYFWEDFCQFWRSYFSDFGWRYRSSTFFYLNETQQPGPRRLQDLYFSKYISWLRNHFLQFL